MREDLRPDLCVIGAGAAGLSVAVMAASFGVPVVLIERGRMGGDCLNVGCVPSKALIAAGNRLHTLRGAARFGIGRGRSEPAVKFAAVRAHVRDVIAAIAPNDSAERLTALGVHVIKAEARFTDQQTLVADRATIRARRFVLATGSEPFVPPIPGLDGIPFLTNETVFDLIERPRHLIVLGAGSVGVEIAQAHRRLGAQVTIVEAAPRLLPREDPEMASVVERALRADEIVLRVGAGIERLEAQPEDVIAALIRHGEQVERVEASHLLVAAGRRAVTEGLRLDAGGIATDQTGIVVDRGLRTSNRRVYAIGDCAGGAAAGGRFTHVANHHAGLVIRNALFRLPVRVDAQPIARVTFTDPELAAVGLSEEEARAAGWSVRVLRWPVAENDRAQAERNTSGHVKAVVTPRGRILGCAIAAPHAGELIVPWTLAMSKGLKVQDLAALVFPYPTYSEVTKRTAVEFLRPAALKPWLRRMVGLARRLG